MKLSCIAIDDEPLALELLMDNIAQVPFLELRAGFHKPIEAVQYLNEHAIDLVFLDIQMPGLSGLQLIQSLHRKPLFIFITAYEQYALKGYELDVVDYLVKPVAMDRFLKACNKARELHASRNSSQTPVAAAAPGSNDFMFVQADYKLVKLNFSDILFVEGLKDYVRFHLDNNQKDLVARVNMRTLEEQLPADSFIRIHKSFIVAKRAITAVQKNTVFAANTELPVGDSFKEELQKFTGKGLQ